MVKPRLAVMLSSALSMIMSFCATFCIICECVRKLLLWKCYVGLCLNFVLKSMVCACVRRAFSYYISLDVFTSQGWIERKRDTLISGLINHWNGNELSRLQDHMFSTRFIRLKWNFYLVFVSESLQELNCKSLEFSHFSLAESRMTRMLAVPSAAHLYKC